MILPLAAMLLSGCPFAPGKKPGTEKPSPYLAQSSPANCLTNLRQAYVDRNYTEYEKLLSEDFTFVFNERDINDPSNPTPPQWARVDELESTRNIFETDLIDRIELSFVQDAAESADDEFPGANKVQMHEIYLRLDTRKPDGSPLQQVVNSGLATFYFRTSDSATASDGKPLVSIFRWVDGGLGTKSLAAKPDA